MANSRATVIALICLFALSRAAAAPPETDESDATKVSYPLTKPFLVNDNPVNAEKDPNPAVPLTSVSFRPINRRFAVGSKHPCRHGYRIHRPAAMEKNVEIHYGNDMIAGENGDFEFHGGDRRHHHHHDEDSDSDDEEEDHGMKKIVIKRRYRYGRSDREKALKVLKKWKKHVGEKEGKTKKTGGFFMKRVRKFLDHYF